MCFFPSKKSYTSPHDRVRTFVSTSASSITSRITTIACSLKLSASHLHALDVPSLSASLSNAGSISCRFCREILEWNSERDFASPLVRYSAQYALHDAARHSLPQRLLHDGYSTPCSGL